MLLLKVNYWYERQIPYGVLPGWLEVGEGKKCDSGKDDGKKREL